MGMLLPRSEVQPVGVDFALPDGVFIKQYLIPECGCYVPQHSHKYDHTTMLAVGAIRVWCDGVLVGDFDAPMPIMIGAGTKHLFQTLAANTLIYCIHNISRTGEVEIIEEHQICT